MRRMGGRWANRSILLVQIVTLSRGVACIVFACIARPPGYRILASAIYIYATVSDAIDGWLARKLACCTPGGAALDWFGDKYLNFVSMLYAYSSGMNALPCIMVVLRDLLVQAFRDVRVGHASLFRPRRGVGILTTLPVRAATLLLLLRDPTSLHWSAIESLFWLAGLTSLICLILAVIYNWRGMTQVFQAARN